MKDSLTAAHALHDLDAGQKVGECWHSRNRWNLHSKRKAYHVLVMRFPLAEIDSFFASRHSVACTNKTFSARQHFVPTIFNYKYDTKF